MAAYCVVACAYALAKQRMEKDKVPCMHVRTRVHAYYLSSLRTYFVWLSALFGLTVGEVRVIVDDRQVVHDTATHENFEKGVFLNRF